MEDHPFFVLFLIVSLVPSSEGLIFLSEIRLVYLVSIAVRPISSVKTVMVEREERLA